MKYAFMIVATLLYGLVLLDVIDKNVSSTTWGAVIAGTLLMGIGAMIGNKEPTEGQDLINWQRNKIRIRKAKTSLPVVEAGLVRKAHWGLMRRKLKGGGRRELGNMFILGAPGRGKSSLLKYWLANSDALNFIVVDLKGDLWKSSAGHRESLGPVYRFDLTSKHGHAFDGLDTNDALTAIAAFEAFLPTNTDTGSDYFNAQAQEIALAYWRAARATRQSAMPILVRAANLPVHRMVELAENILRLIHNEGYRNRLLREFENAFGLLWENPDADGERNSVVRSFKGAFSKLNSPEIMSSISSTTFDVADIVEKRGTIYISAPSTNAPYAVPIQLILSGIITAINDYVDNKRNAKQGQDIVILADEAGVLRIPLFVDTLATGRSRGLSMAAFFQTLGQLDQYHKRGWRGLVDTTHHWTFFNSNDPDVHEFLRKRCGQVDGKNCFDEISYTWKETQVISLLDYDRIYPVFGNVINPYGHRATAKKMQMETPQLPALEARPRVRLGRPKPKPEQTKPTVSLEKAKKGEMKLVDLEDKKKKPNDKKENLEELKKLLDKKSENF